MKTRHIILALTVAIFVFLMAGCTNKNNNINPTLDGVEIVERTISLKDGRTITCISMKDYIHEGGLGSSCDWDNVKERKR